VFAGIVGFLFFYLVATYPAYRPYTQLRVIAARFHVRFARSTVFAQDFTWFQYYFACIHVTWLSDNNCLNITVALCYYPRPRPRIWVKQPYTVMSICCPTLLECRGSERKCIYNNECVAPDLAVLTWSDLDLSNASYVRLRISWQLFATVAQQYNKIYLQV